MFFIALPEVYSVFESHEGNGFVTFIAASDQGVVDISDRRPLVLSPKHAQKGLDSHLARRYAAEQSMDC